jgi:hypothetical protein
MKPPFNTRFFHPGRSLSRSTICSILLPSNDDEFVSKKLQQAGRTLRGVALRVCMKLSMKSSSKENLAVHVELLAVSKNLHKLL